MDGQFEKYEQLVHVNAHLTVQPFPPILEGGEGQLLGFYNLNIEGLVSYTNIWAG